MTVEANLTRFSYTGDGTSTVFPFPTRFLASSYIEVRVGGLLVTTGVTVTGANNPNGGAVTFMTAPAAGLSIELARATARVQLTSFQGASVTLGSTLEPVADRLTMIAQEEAAEVDEIQGDLSDLATDVDASLAALSVLKTKVDTILAFPPGGIGFTPVTPFAVTGGSPAIVKSLADWLGRGLDLGMFAGTGETNYHDALQTFGNFCIAQRRVLRIPEGTFPIAGGVSFIGGLTIVGAGKNLTDLRWVPGGTGDGIDITLPFSPADDNFGANAFVRDLRLTTTKPLAGTALRVRSPATAVERVTSRFAVRDALVRGATNPTIDGWTRGLWADGCCNTTFRDISFVGRISRAGSIDTYLSVDAIRYANDSGASPHPSVFRLNSSDVYYAQQGVYGYDYEGLFIDGGCNIVGCDIGVLAGGPNSFPHTSIIGNHINARVGAVRINTVYETIIQGNLLYSQESSGPTNIIDVFGSARFVTITGNQLENYNNTFSANGIVITAANAGIVSSNIFRRTNSINGAANGLGLWLTSGSAGFLAKDNVFIETTTTVLNQGTNNTVG